MRDITEEPRTLAEFADWIEAQIKIAAGIPMPTLRLLAYVAPLERAERAEHARREASALVEAPVGDASSGPAPWGDRHEEESLRYLMRALSSPEHIVGTLLDVRHADGLRLTRADVSSEEGLRRAVVRWVDMSGEERAVREVRDFAEGRKVCETDDRWHVRLYDGGGAHTSSAMGLAHRT